MLTPKSDAPADRSNKNVLQSKKKLSKVKEKYKNQSKKKYAYSSSEKTDPDSTDLSQTISSTETDSTKKIQHQDKMKNSQKEKNTPKYDFKNQFTSTKYDSNQNNNVSIVNDLHGNLKVSEYNDNYNNQNDETEMKNMATYSENSVQDDHNKKNKGFTNKPTEKTYKAEIQRNENLNNTTYSATDNYHDVDSKYNNTSSQTKNKNNNTQNSSSNFQEAVTYSDKPEYAMRILLYQYDEKNSKDDIYNKNNENAKPTYPVEKIFEADRYISESTSSVLQNIYNYTDSSSESNRTNSNHVVRETSSNLISNSNQEENQSTISDVSAFPKAYSGYNKNKPITIQVKRKRRENNVFTKFFIDVKDFFIPNKSKTVDLKLTKPLIKNDSDSEDYVYDFESTTSEDSDSVTIRFY